MKHSIVAVLAAVAIWTGILPAASAENALVGTWQLTSFSLIVLDRKETSRPYGDHPTGGDFLDESLFVGNPAVEALGR